MRICVLSSPPGPDDIPYDPSHYFIGLDWQHFIPSPQNYRAELEQLAADGVDVFVNLCDGTPDDDLSGIGLVQHLEQIGAGFTGAGSAFFDPSRREMKDAATRAGVPIPGTHFVEQFSDLEQMDAAMRYPLLVKPGYGFASVGLTKDSRVDDFSALQQQAALTLSSFNTALIEEFIEGREFTVLVAENAEDASQPLVFRPVEFLFPPGEKFKHYYLKWIEYQRMSARPVQEPALEQRLKDYARAVFLAMQGSGYARCDFRMDSQGDIYFLEINPNCGIFYPPGEPGSADFILLNDPLGHAGFLDHMLKSALRRKRG